MELASDSLVTPPGVLPDQAEDEIPELRIQRGSTGGTVRPGPLPGHELAVPPQQRLGSNHEGTPNDPARGPGWLLP
jgi:hypothetical protein